VGINKRKNPAYLIGVTDEIFPRKGTMLELKTRGILNWPVSSTPLDADPKIAPVYVRLPHQETRESEVIMHYEEQQGFSQQPYLAQPFAAAATSPYHQHHLPHYPPPPHPSHFLPPVQNNHHTYSDNNMYYAGWEQQWRQNQHHQFGPTLPCPALPCPSATTSLLYPPMVVKYNTANYSPVCCMYSACTIFCTCSRNVYSTIYYMIFYYIYIIYY
jgi:hypothetical protein